MDRARRTHRMASTMVRFEPSRFSPAGTPKTLVYAAPVYNVESLVIAFWIPVTTTTTSLNGFGGP
jgi:hypothetical protein